MKTHWAILLNSVPIEEAILTPPVLDEPSKDEMIAPSSRWWEDDSKVPGNGSAVWKGWAQKEENCWVRAENWGFLEASPCCSQPVPHLLLGRFLKESENSLPWREGRTYRTNRNQKDKCDIMTHCRVAAYITKGKPFQRKDWESTRALELELLSCDGGLDKNGGRHHGDQFRPWLPVLRRETQRLGNLVSPQITLNLPSEALPVDVSKSSQYTQTRATE